MWKHITKNSQAILTFILAIAVGLRMILLNQSFWMDEAAQALESSRPLSKQLDILADFQPPLFHIIVHFFTLVSTSEWYLRLASFIPGILTVLFVYKLSRLLFAKREVAMYSTLFLSLSSYHIFFSQELRPYALACFFGTASWYALVHILKDKKKNISTLFYIITSACGLYSMYVYPFLLFSQLVYVGIWERKHIKRFLFSWIMTALLFLPWAPTFLQQFHIGSQLRTSLPGWEDVVSVPQWKSLPMVVMKFFSGVVPMSYSKATTVYVLLGFVLLMVLKLFFLQSIKVKKIIENKQFMMLCVWFGISVFSAWVISFVVPVLSPKRALFAQPAFFMCIAFMLSSLRKHVQTIMGIVLSIYLLISVYAYWNYPQFQRENWRGSILNLHQEFGDTNTLALFSFDAPFAPWPWYTSRFNVQMNSLAVSRTETHDSVLLQKKMMATLSYEHVIVFDYLADLVDQERTIPAFLEQHGYTLEKVIDTQNMGFMRVYKRGKTFVYQVK